MIQYPRYKRHRFSSFQVIIAGFAAVDLVGALLLMLPIAAQQRCVTPFHEALFTSTSALCVTGLVVQDTGSYWSAFGQSVILLLIQIGGLGVITVGAAFALLSGRKISLKQRSTMQEATAAPQMGGIVRLTGFILRITALFELTGAALLLPTFCADYGLRGIWYALFHSISAFCNAGFDLLGTEGAKFVSLTRYAGNPLLTTVIAALIVFGGLGFLTWEDIYTYRLDFHRYRMQSKVILVTTAFLLVLPTLYFYCFEFTAGSARQRILLSMFQSVTPRTAGFNTADLAAMGSTSQALMVVLMLLGGSPGSTAGGMKTTTFAVLLANMWATFRRREDAEFFGRRIDSSAVKNAATIAGMYLTLFFLGAFVIATAEQLPMSVCLYETASAVATVGLTLGITPQLGILSQGVLIETMRREGYELQVGQPRVIVKEIDGKKCEPVEELTVDCPETCSGTVIELATKRKGTLRNMTSNGDRVRLEFDIPSRGIIGLRSNMLTATAGEAIMTHRLKDFEPWVGEIEMRTNGSIISGETGTAFAYSIDKLQDRGRFFISPMDQVYEGQVIGEHTRQNDITVNVTKAKQLTNMRASGSDDKTSIAPPKVFTLEEALEYIQADEYVEVTPHAMRLRKILLHEVDRKRASK